MPPAAGTGAAPLRLALGSLRRRYGQEVIRTASQEVLQGLSTGVGELDRITGCGGLPQGRITRLGGGVGSGAFDLGLALAARVGATGLLALVDFTKGVDPGELDAYGGDLGNTWVVRPRSPLEGWAAARALARAGVGLCLLVLDPGDPGPSPGAAAALLAGLVEGGGAGLLLGEWQPPLALRSRVSLELGCQRLEWLLANGDVSGMRLRVQVLRSHLGAPGTSCRLRLRFPRPYPGMPGLAQEVGREMEPVPLPLVASA